MKSTNWHGILILAALLVTARGTLAEEKCSDPSLDNFKHPPGTVTAPLGSLGRVDKEGTGPIPMILIPGAAFGGSIWKDFMERNKDRYTMYAITPSGYEGTKPPPWPDTDDFSRQVWTDALLKAIVKLINDEKLDKPVIVGHHMLGDYYALRLALENPDKVRAAVVIAGMPSMALPAFGQNKPGETPKTANPEQRKQMVKSFFLPFYKTVTEKMWRAGSFKARTFCRDARRGAELFDLQVSVPIPTQLGYFFEYQSADLEPSLSKLAVPLLVVLPKQSWTLDTILDNFRESNEMMYGDRDKARAAWTTQLTTGWGSVEEGVKWQFDPAYRWERLRGVIPNMTIRYVNDSGIFIMEDQAHALDEELRNFTAGIMTMAISKIQLIMLGATDLKRSAAFYHDQLGLEVQAASDEFVFLKGGTIGIGLSKGLAKAVTPVAGAVEVVFGVDDVHSAYRALKAKGIQFLGEPKQATPREWVANFRDPDGHLLSIFGRPGP